MARHFTFITTALIVLGLLTHTGAKAQGQDANHVWKGNPLSNIVDKTDDMGTVYLYNVGTGKYLNTGSYWGTVVIGFNVGMTTHVQKTSKKDVYTMTGPLETTEGKYIAFGRRMDTPGHDNFINYNRVYVDRGVDYEDPFTNTTHKNGILNWKIEKTGDGSNTYYIHCSNSETSEGMGGEIYLSMAHRGKGKTYDIKYPNTPDGDYSKWRFVTKKDLKDDFKDTYASDENPSDATFLIYDQNFERGNIYVKKWEESGGLRSAYAKKTGRDGIEKEIQYIFDPSSSNYTYYVGNGAISSNYYMAQYAGYTTANVRNVGNDTNANGKITQSVKTIKKGWYKVTCNGFYNRGNGSNMVSKLFARVRGTNTTISNVSTELNKFNKEFSYTKDDMLKVYDEKNLPKPKGSDPLISPYVNAGMQFEMGKYNNTVLVYVPDKNSTLDIGIEISNSTDDLDWTCWDNVQLQYCGSNDLVLDEGQENINYIKQQVNASTSGTLILKRTMKIDTWSSIMLPVDLTAGQVKTAFGENVKLSHHPKQHDTVKTRIEFKSVDLSNDDDVVIKANELYLIKPMKVPTGFNQEDPYEKQLQDGSTIKVKAPYYVINSVSLKRDPSELGNYTNGVIKESSTTSTTKDEKLQFCGSLIKQTSNIVPENSYALGSKDGKWHFTQNALPIKGFRCWIATGSQAYAKTIRFFIDGVEEDMVTGIDNIVVENGNNNEVMGTVYNLNGQVVRTGATSLEGLPKGIYIVNNKKYIVK